MNKYVFYNQFIKKIIFFTIFAIAIIFASFAYIIQSDSINNNLKNKNSLFADMIFENLYTTMRKGGDIYEIQALIKKLENRIEHSDINIYKNINDTEQEHVKEVFISKEPAIFQHGGHVDFAKPIIFQKECTACHTSAKPGDIAAVMQVETPYLEIDISLEDILVSILFLFVSSSLIIFVIWFFYFRKVFISPLEKMVQQMLRINNHDDLDDLIDIDTKIKELKDIEIVFNKQALQLQNSFKKIEHLSNTDALTKLFNRRKFIEDVEDLMSVCRRYNQTFTIISIDLNKFKPINDTYGHNIGDLVLKEFSNTIKKSIRTSDKFYRVGGDEFILLLTNTKVIDSGVVIKNLKNELSKIHININGHEINVSASFGTCEFTEQIESIEQLLVIADKEMYKDKLNIKQGF